MSLAHLLLGAGASSVVATRWDVRDQDGEAVARLFHQRLQAGQDPTKALQETQVELLRRAATARSWAAFYLIGRGR